MWQGIKSSKGAQPVRSSQSEGGFMVVEVIIALVLAGLLIISVMAVLSGTRKLQADSRSRQQALDYAREAMEIISNIQQDEFGCTSSCACTALPGYNSCWQDAGFGDVSDPLELVVSGSTWDLQEISGANWADDTKCAVITGTNFYRTIKVENDPEDVLASDRNNDIKKVTVEVSWPNCLSDKKISLSTILTAWKNL